MLQSEAGYIDARPLTARSTKLLQRTAGGSIAVGRLPPGWPRVRLASKTDLIPMAHVAMLIGSLTKPRSIAMQVNATSALKRVPWNKGKLTGAKPPLRPKHVWSIRTKFQIEGRARDLAI